MHLTCTNISEETVIEALHKAKASGIQNILALRGDPPAGTDKWEATEGGCNNAVDLVPAEPPSSLSRPTTSPLIRLLLALKSGCCKPSTPGDADGGTSVSTHLRSGNDLHSNPHTKPSTPLILIS